MSSKETSQQSEAIKKSTILTSEKTNQININNNNSHLKNTIKNLPEILAGYCYYVIAYPFLRKFLEIKYYGLQKPSTNFYFPKSKEINFSIKSRNGYYAGVSSFFLSHLFQLNLLDFHKESTFYQIYYFNIFD